MEKAKKILNTLNRNGFESYVVGGAVRDMSMGLSPNDIDIIEFVIEKFNLKEEIYERQLKEGSY